MTNHSMLAWFLRMKPLCLGGKPPQSNERHYVKCLRYTDHSEQGSFSPLLLCVLGAPGEDGISICDGGA